MNETTKIGDADELTLETSEKGPVLVVGDRRILLMVYAEIDGDEYRSATNLEIVTGENDEHKWWHLTDEGDPLFSISPGEIEDDD